LRQIQQKTDAYTAPAPLKGCYISVEICSSTFTRKEQIKYTDRVFIPAGKKSAEFRIDINDKDSDMYYYLYYFSSNIADMGFSKSAVMHSTKHQQHHQSLQSPSQFNHVDYIIIKNILTFYRIDIDFHYLRRKP
ncbi:MAG TPA: hypothetical protein PLJ39_14300, partial [Spirochaetota bacterium]|nr:hypothetical protein [Spirochaetota bacterium]